MNRELIVVAMGGNAFLKKGESDNIDIQWRNIKTAIKGVADLIVDGYEVVITHGNGPQVGKILEWVAKYNEFILPIDIAVAMTQGWLGYMIQQSLYNELYSRGMKKEIICIVNNVLVDKGDPAFREPSKPIGSYYNKSTADRLERKYGWVMRNDVRGGYRRVVPSPDPLDNLEFNAIKTLLDSGYIVIACGGGGIPIIREDGLRGVEAVIDKDLASALLASKLGAEYLLILTDVDAVYLNYGKKDMRRLDKVLVSELEKYYNKGEFPPGSMGPKILACINFIKRGGKKAMIGHLKDTINIIKGLKGTQIIPD